jgi:uncharacterized protein YceH (UPF0502 family)
MSVRLLAAAALALPLVAHAADWIRVDVADEQQHFYDRSNLSIEGSEIAYWRRVVFRTPQAVAAGVARMAMYRERIDCKARTFRVLGYLLYGQDGNVLENVYTPEAEAEAIAPGTVGERYESIMCGLLAHGAQTGQPTSPELHELQAEIQQLESRLRVLKERLRELGAGPEVRAPPAAGGQQ